MNATRATDETGELVQFCAWQMMRMQGHDRQPDGMFSYVSAQERVSRDHAVRPIRALVDDGLRQTSRELDRSDGQPQCARVLYFTRTYFPGPT